MARNHLARLLVVAIAAALAVMAFGPAAPARAGAPADRLVLQPTDLPGFAPAAGTAQQARRAFGRVLARGMDGAPRPLRVEAAAYAAPGGRRLDVQAFEFGTPQLARAAARGWARAQRRAGSAPVASVAGAQLVARTSAGGARVAALTRAGSVVIVVAYRSPAALQDARAVAEDYVRLQADRVAAVGSRSAADRVMDGVRADGSLPPATVLQLAALLFGPIPGVELPRGSRDELPPIDATTLMEQLGAIAPALTAAQRRGLAQVLAIPATRVPAINTPRETGRCLPSVDGRPLDVNHTAEATALRDTIAGSISGLRLVPTWIVCVYSYTTPRGRTNAETAPWGTSATSSPFHPNFFDEHLRRNLGTQDECFMGLFPRFYDTPVQNQRMQLAHEAYHCVHQEWGHGTVLADNMNPYWVEESLATWAGHQVAPATYEPADKVPGEFFRAWHADSAAPLFERGYIGWGFLGVVEQAAGAGAIWNRIVPVWQAHNSSTAAYAAIVGSNEGDVLDTWGAGHFREPGFPSAWLQRLPFSVPDPGGADRNTILTAIPGASVRVPVSGFRAKKLVMRGIEAPLVQVSIEGNGRITDGHTEWVRPAGQWFCFEGRCACPQGQHLRTPLPAHTDIGQSLYAGFAAGAGTSTLVVAGHAMGEFCEPDPCPVRQRLNPPHEASRQLLSGEVCEPPRSGGGPGPGGATTHNDPHLVTFDGVAYDLQSAGEFVLARAEDGSYEVQARQQAADDLGLASSNTAVAIRTDGHRIGVYSVAGQEPSLRVDGRVRPLDREARLEVGPAQIRRYGETYLVRSADGSQVTVDAWRRGALRITIDASDVLFARLRGTLGSNDGDPTNDLITAGGQLVEYTLPAGGDLRVPRFGAGVNDFAWIHGPYADSWRVKGAASLFDYRRGESAATFVDRSVPRAEVSLADLSAAARARARLACAAIADLWFRRSCERDVALTNDAGFAGSSARAERDRAGWRPLDGFESRVGPLSAVVAGDGTVVFAALNAVFGAETLATAVALPRGAAPRAPFLIERGLVGDPFLYRDLDGQVAATLPVFDLSTGDGAIRTYALPASGTVTRGPDVARLSDFRGPVPAAAGPFGLLTAANGFGVIDVRVGTDPDLPATPAPPSGDCSPVAPNLTGGGGAVWLAWTGAFCAASGPRAMLVAPATGTAALGPLVAPGAVPNVLLPATSSTQLAARPDGTALMAYPGVNRVLAWRVGEGAQPVELATTGDATTDTVLVSAEPTTGRVWVAWRDPAKGVLVVRRSDVDGRAFAAPRPVSPPMTISDADRRLGQWTIVADDGRLVVAFAVPGSSSRSGSAWYTVLR